MDQFDEVLLDPADFGLRVGPMDQYVAELFRCDPELRRVRNDFLRNLSKTMSVIRKAAEISDYKTVQERVHALRGSAGNYGFIDLHAWATALDEELLGCARPAVIESLLSESAAFDYRH